MKNAVFTSILFLICLSSYGNITSIIIEKRNRKLFLMDKNEVIKSYKVVLGRSPVGNKVKEGDNKTPEGKYYIDNKNPQSKYHLSLHISYPNKEDRKRAKKQGVDPGRDIMIHGLPNNISDYMNKMKSVNLDFVADTSNDFLSWLLMKFDWTRGCVALTNENIEEIYDLVDMKTPVYIKP